jgi:hypothetical protein
MIAHVDSVSGKLHMEFILGLICGAVFGVIADRIWSHFEGLPRFRVRLGMYQAIGDKEGFTLTVENVGKKTVPPFIVQLYHPFRGSLAMFHSKDATGELEPDQKNEYQLQIFEKNKYSEHLHIWLHTEKNETLKEINYTDFMLRLAMEKSERVLFQDQKLGSTLAYMIVESMKKGHVSFCEKGMQLYVSQTPFLKEWFKKRKERLKLEAVKKEMDKKNAGVTNVAEKYEANKTGLHTKE